MFEQLSDKLNLTFEKLRGRARVTEADLEEALRDVRVALLEADVSLRVVKQLVATVRERAIGEKVLESITGAQQVVKIVHDALVEMLGGAAEPIARAPQPPTVILLVGLQGSGKTTTAASSRTCFASRAGSRCSSRPTSIDPRPSSSSRHSASSSASR